MRDLLPTFLEIAGSSIPQDMDGQSLLRLMEGKTDQWRKYIDLEHATCYSPDNYWCALTDGKIKYIWRFHTGTEAGQVPENAECWKMLNAGLGDVCKHCPSTMLYGTIAVKENAYNRC